MENYKSLQSGRSVSCVIPCYNCETTIERCVQSVLDQSDPVSEIILVDDCSVDATAGLLKKLADGNSRIKPIFLSRNGGPSRARNTGWDVARGDFIAFLDADDTWHPQKIELQMRVLDAFPDVEIVGHLSEVLTRTAPYKVYEISGLHINNISNNVIPKLAVLKNPWSTPAVIVKRDIPHRFDEQLRAAEDYLLWCSILLSGHAGARLNLPLCRLYKPRYGAGGLSGDLKSMEKGELRAIRKMRSMHYIGTAFSILATSVSMAKYIIRILTALRPGR